MRGGGKISLSLETFMKRKKKCIHNNYSVTVKAGNLKYKHTWTGTHIHAHTHTQQGTVERTLNLKFQPQPSRLGKHKGRSRFFWS